MLAAIVSNAPAESLRPAAACLAALISGPAREVALATLGNWPALAPDVRTKVVQAASSMSGPRSIALLRDAAAVARGDEDADVLLAYQLL